MIMPDHAMLWIKWLGFYSHIWALQLAKKLIQHLYEVRCFKLRAIALPETNLTGRPNWLGDDRSGFLLGWRAVSALFHERCAISISSKNNFRTCVSHVKICFSFEEQNAQLWIFSERIWEIATMFFFSKCKWISGMGIFQFQHSRPSKRLKLIQAAREANHWNCRGKFVGPRGKKSLPGFCMDSHPLV